MTTSLSSKLVCTLNQSVMPSNARVARMVPGSAAGQHLGLPQVPVVARLPDELVVVAALHDAPLLQYDDLVHLLQALEPVRDEQRGAVVRHVEQVGHQRVG